MKSALPFLLLSAAANARIPSPSPEFIEPPDLPWGAIATVGGVAACAAALDSFALITQGNACLVERLGRYKRTITAGLHPKMPIIERLTAHTSIRERVLDVPAQRCITKDNAPLSADAVVFFRITDLTKAKYAIDDYEIGVSNLVLTQLRSEIGQLTLDETFCARERLNAILLREANAVTSGWGIDVVRVEVRDILPSPEIVASMELQMAAERKKRAEILESEGKRQAVINAAQAKRDAVVLAAAGEQERLQKEADGLAAALAAIANALAHPDSSAAARLLLDRARVAADVQLAMSPNSKVVIQGGGGGAASGAAIQGAALGLGAEAVPPA